MSGEGYNGIPRAGGARAGDVALAIANRSTPTDKILARGVAWITGGCLLGGVAFGALGALVDGVAENKLVSDTFGLLEAGFYMGFGALIKEGLERIHGSDAPSAPVGIPDQIARIIEQQEDRIGRLEKPAPPTEEPS